MKHRFLIATFILTLLTFSQASFAATTFNDVNSNTPYVDDIYWTVNEGITSGYADGSGNWGPDNCVTRAELLKMVYEYGVHVPFSDVAAAAENPYKDVKRSDWFYDYVISATTGGEVEGYEDSTFRPNDCVNRVEAMKVALNILMPYQEKHSSVPLYYDDKAIVDMEGVAWYGKYARPMFENRIVGTQHTQWASNGNDPLKSIYFYPDGDMTRKEVAHMIKQISLVYPRLGCERSGGTYETIGTNSCDCSKVDNGNGDYNEDRGYCEMENGEPAGEINSVFKLYQSKL